MEYIGIGLTVSISFAVMVIPPFALGIAFAIKGRDYAPVINR